MVWWRTGIAAVAVALAAGGCGGSSVGTTTEKQAGLAATGSLRNTYLRDDGTVEPAVPADIAQYAVSALVPEGGAFRESAGTFGADGSFTVPDTGSGRYLLRVLTPGQVAPRYFAGSARNLALGADQVGRASRTFAVAATPVTLAVSGLEAWAAGNTFSLLATNTRLSLTLSTTSLPATGSTSASFPIEFRNRPLPAPGDGVWVYETVQRTSGSIPYTIIGRSADLTGLLAPADGSTVSVPVTLVSPPVGTVGLDLHRSEFLAGLPDVAPAATVTAASFGLSVRAVPRSFGAYYTSALYPILFSATLPPDASDFDFGPIGYPRPFPASFVEIRVSSLVMTIQVPPALGVPGTSIAYSAGRIEPVANAPASIVPELAPARLPLVAGKDALQPQSGVGLTPVLSWSAPALGAPSHYIVQIYELLGGTATVRGSIYVRETSTPVPPLLLQAGKVYLANVIAVAEPNFDFAMPNRLTLPRELVPLFTAPFTP